MMADLIRRVYMEVVLRLSVFICVHPRFKCLSYYFNRRCPQIHADLNQASPVTKSNTL